MAIDSLLVLCSDQAVTSTADSEYTLDFGAADPNQGRGTPLVLHVEVDTTFTATGAGTLTVDLQESDDNSSWASLGILTGAIGKATLVSGYKILSHPLPQDFARYMKLVFTVATGPFTAGIINAWVEPVA